MVRPRPTPQTSFTFTAVGTHPVTLTVTDNEGASDSDSVNIVVDPVPNVSPTAAAAGDLADDGQGSAGGVVLLGRFG